MAKNNSSQQAPENVQLTKMEKFVVKYKKQIGITVGVLLAVVVIGFCYVKLYSEPRETEASTALAKAQERYMSALSAQGDTTGMAKAEWEAALNGDKKITPMGFTQIIDEYSGTKAANLAELYAGICYSNLGKWQQAADAIEDYSTKSDAMVSPMAECALGDAYANLKQLDKAVDCYKKAAKDADAALETGHNEAVSPIALLKAGQILESQNKKSEALEIYKDIKAKYLNSPLQGNIDAYIERCSE